MTKPLINKEISKYKWRKHRLHHISATGTLITFLDCPLQFWFNKIAKFPYDTDKPYFELGTAVHNANEVALLEMMDGKKVTSKVKAKMRKSCKAYLEEARDKFKPGFWGRQGFKAYLKQGLEMTNTAFERYKDMPIKPLAVEKEYNVAYDEDIYLMGKVDLVCEFTDTYKSKDKIVFKKGDILLLDHKTASQKYNPIKVHNSPQLTFYAYLFRNVEFIEEDYVGFQKFMKYKEPVILDLISTRKEIDFLVLQSILKKIDKTLKDGDFYPTLNVDVCKWCEHRSRCKKYTLRENRKELEDKLIEEGGFKLAV